MILSISEFNSASLLLYLITSINCCTASFSCTSRHPVTSFLISAPGKQAGSLIKGYHRLVQNGNSHFAAVIQKINNPPGRFPGGFGHYSGADRSSIYRRLISARHRRRKRRAAVLVESARARAVRRNSPVVPDT